MKISRSKNFEKSLRRVLSGGKVQIGDIENVIMLLAQSRKMPPKYKDHALLGEWKGYRECHIKPDLLLIYQIHQDILVLVLIDIGSHAQLFG